MPDSSPHSGAGGAQPSRPQADPASDIDLIRRVLASNGCDGLSSKTSDSADFALTRIQEQLEAAQELLKESLDWIERPVGSQEDAAMFLVFEERVERLLLGRLLLDSNPASEPKEGNMGGVLHQERADHLRRAAQNQESKP